MDTTMEHDELKAAWQSLDRQLERQNHLDLQLLRDNRVEKARRGLRPLLFGQALQFLLGVGMTLLGVGCWTRSGEVAGLFASGIVLHAFGVLTAVMAALTMAFASSIDYAAPVVTIQKQMVRLLRFHSLNSALCGAPWWVMWVVVVLCFAGLGGAAAGAATPAWIWISLAIGVAGLAATWAYFLRALRRGEAPMAGLMHDGADGIRHGRRLLDDIARFEQE
jgi:hypothetical protein